MYPDLPWEVIERVIGHSAGHRETLRNFSLTCRDLRPQSLRFMVAEAHMATRTQVFDFCDFLQTKPHLKVLVRSIVLPLAHFAPIPLLHILPNLFEIRLSSPSRCHNERRENGVPGFRDQRISTTVLNRSVLIPCQHRGSHIQKLHLFKLVFPTCQEFLQVLSAFTNLTNLICEDITINREGNPAHLAVLKRRLSKRLRLKALTIEFDVRRLGFWDLVAAILGTVSLDTSLAQHTLEIVTIPVAALTSIARTLPLLSWPRLQSLILVVVYDSVSYDTVESITRTTAHIQDFHHPTLKEVVVQLRGSPDAVLHPKNALLYPELEQALLRFSKPRLVWIIESLRAGRRSFWAQELAKFFGMLHGLGHGALTVTACDRDVFAFLPGHEYTVHALVASPNGKWIGSGSEDGSIILWDASDGQIAHQWFAYRYTAVASLAFSPNNQHLLSISCSSPNIVVWDLCGVSCAVLVGHTDRVINCAWSPRGDVIASGSDDNTVRLWDAHTFQLLHVLATAHATAQLVLFSHDGRRLVSMYHPWQSCDIHIWDVESGKIHRTLYQANLYPPYPPYHASPPYHELIAASFNPESTRLSTVNFHSEVRGLPTIWDVESGQELLVLRYVGNGTADVAFCPTDGRLVVTAACDGGLKLWDAVVGAELCSLEGHRHIVSRVVFSPCGRYIASASADHTVRLWKTSAERGGASLVATFSEHQVGVRHVAFSGDGRTLWSAALDGTVFMRRICDVVSADERRK